MTALSRYWRNLFARIAIVHTSLACAPDKKYVDGSGTLVPASIPAAVLNSHGRRVFAAATLDGKPDLTIFQVKNGRLEKSVARTPQSTCSYPVALTVADVNGDGTSELLIFDSACGPWISMRQGDEWLPTPWTTYLPSLEVNYYLSYENIFGDENPELVGSNPNYFAGFSKQADDSWQPFSAEIWGLTNPNQLYMSRMAMGLATPDLSGVLVQQGEYLSVWAPPDTGGHLNLIGKLIQSELEYLKPFDVYDQLTPIRPIAGCGLFAVGIGLFVPSRFGPQPAVALQVLDGGRYAAKNLLTESDRAVMLSSTTVAGIEFLGVLASAQSGLVATVLRRSDCQTFEPVGSSRTQWHPSWWKFPIDSNEDTVKISGEPLMAFPGEDVAAFCHYDGRRLFCFEYGVATGTLTTSVVE